MPKIVPRIDPEFTAFRLRVAYSRIHRWGVYAMENIPPNRKVIEYTGELVSRKEAKKRGMGKLTYLFTIDPYWCKDGAVGGSGAELINHSCDPNIRAVVMKGHILYMSKRRIRKGDELTVDYNFDKDVETVRCKCGSAKCRGTINNHNR
jgi:SET domain-containing protein